MTITRPNCSHNRRRTGNSARRIAGTFARNERRERSSIKPDIQ
jgi:hypothetical protein